jgi:transporter family protein
MRIMLFSLLAMLSWGVAPVFGKIGLRDVSPLLGLSVRTFVVAIVLLVIGLATGELSGITRIQPRDILFLAGEGILASLIGHFAYFFALKYGAVSTTVPFIAAYPLVTMIIGLSFLREPFSWQKLAGALFVAGGLFLLKY